MPQKKAVTRKEPNTIADYFELEGIPEKGNSTVRCEVSLNENYPLKDFEKLINEFTALLPKEYKWKKENEKWFVCAVNGKERSQSTWYTVQSKIKENLKQFPLSSTAKTENIQKIQVNTQQQEKQEKGEPEINYFFVEDKNEMQDEKEKFKRCYINLRIGLKEYSQEKIYSLYKSVQLKEGYKINNPAENDAGICYFSNEKALSKSAWRTSIHDAITKRSKGLVWEELKLDFGKETKELKGEKIFKAKIHAEGFSNREVYDFVSPVLPPHINFKWEWNDKEQQGYLISTKGHSYNIFMSIKSDTGKLLKEKNAPAKSEVKPAQQSAPASVQNNITNNHQQGNTYNIFNINNFHYNPPSKKEPIVIEVVENNAKSSNKEPEKISSDSFKSSKSALIEQSIFANIPKLDGMEIVNAIKEKVGGKGEETNTHSGTVELPTLFSN